MFQRFLNFFRHKHNWLIFESEDKMWKIQECKTCRETEVIKRPPPTVLTLVAEIRYEIH